MAEFYGLRIIYTANDEMPDCMLCDNCDGDFDCSNKCGAKYGWSAYHRTVWLDRIVTKIKGDTSDGNV